MLSLQLSEENLVRHNSEYDGICSSQTDHQYHTERVAAASTAAPSEPVGGRWADMIDSDDDEQTNMPISLVTKTPKVAPPETRKTRWADLASDSDADDAKSASLQVPAVVSQRQPCPRPASTKVTRGQHVKKERNEKPSKQQSEVEALPDDTWEMAGTRRKQGQRPKKDASGWVESRDKTEKTPFGQQLDKKDPTGILIRGGHERKDRREASKLQCQFVIGIEQDRKFDVVRKVLGSAGANMKRIALDTDVKLRLRGRGSKFLEGPEKKESSDPLMLCLSASSPAGYSAAVSAVEQLLHNVYADHRDFCVRAGLPKSELGVQMHEGARDGAR